MSLPSYTEALHAVSSLSLRHGRNQEELRVLLNHAVRIFAPTLPEDILARCARVCKEWSVLCKPLLWNDPVHIFLKKRNPCATAARFYHGKALIDPQLTSQNLVRTLDWAALSTAKDFHASDNFVTMSDWIKLDEISCRYLEFVNLQFEILDGLDGNISSAESYQINRLKFNAGDSHYARFRHKIPTNLVLLSVAHCYTFDATKILDGFLMFDLVFLDLSFTLAHEMIANKFNILSFPNLRILKLRGLRLTDQKLHAILSSDRFGLWSLDVRDNLLTDATITYLLSRRMQPRSTAEASKDWVIHEDPPPYVRDESDIPQWHPSNLPVRPDNKHAIIRYFSRNGKLDDRGRLYLDEDDPLYQSTGLTHLHLSSNKFTSTGIQSLFAHKGSLHVLDIGTVASPNFPLPTPSNPSALLRIPPYLTHTASPYLTTLRIHHSIITSTPTFRTPDLLITESLGLKILTTTAHTRFNPLSNFRVKELTLTDIPTKSYGFVIHALRDLLVRCREQEVLLQQAARGSGGRRAPVLLSGLRTLRLEFVAGDARVETAGGEDRDVDAFYAETARDFSFFAEEEGGAVVEGKGKGLEIIEEEEEGEEDMVLLDVVEELKEFRAEGERWGGKLELVFPRGR